MICPHCEIDCDFDDCVTDPGKKPAEGDAGMCVQCFGWWTIKDGKVIEYLPTDDELLFVASQFEASDIRFEKFLKQKGEKFNE